MGIYNNVDELLESGRRSLRTLPKTCLLGSTGARLWADFLNIAPGFTGAIDFIHKINIPKLFTITSNRKHLFEPSTIKWKPSHLTMTYKNNSIHFHEQKFITWDDCAVSCFTWENVSNQSEVLQLDINENLIQVENDEGTLSGIFKAPKHNFEIRTVIITNDDRLNEGLLLKPREKVNVIVVAALGIGEKDSTDMLIDRAKHYIDSPFEIVVSNHQKKYQEWFDKTPSFISSDLSLNKTWQYRWFILRYNLANPNYGNLQYPLFYEGRSHKMSKTPYSPEGWEFSKMIPLTTPMHLLETRWYHDDVYCKGILKNMEASQDENGLFNCLFVDSTLHSYSNFLGWSAYQYYLVKRDKEFIKTVLPSLKKQVFGEAKYYGNDNDKLLIEKNHKQTGKEYQPSYWYFHNYPDDCMDISQYTPLKRVDRSVYQYLNSLGVANLCEIVSDDDAEELYALCNKVKTDIINKMWDDEENFFFDLHFETDQKAMVKNIVGFYPYWAKITDSKHEASMNYLFDEQYFNTPTPFPSVSVDCPVYTPEGGWKGTFIKGRNGCVWNGPSWPYTNSVVLDALANESKRKNHKYDDQFSNFLREFAWMHYSGHDINRPYLVEHYNSQTGEPISDEVDYNHSYFVDLLIRHVAGLEIEQDRIILDPLNIGLDYFELSNVKVSNNTIKVTYRNPDIQNEQIEPGYRLYVNGKEVYKSERLQKIEYLLERSM